MKVNSQWQRSFFFFFFFYDFFLCLLGFISGCFPGIIFALLALSIISFAWDSFGGVEENEQSNLLNVSCTTDLIGTEWKDK